MCTKISFCWFAAAILLLAAGCLNPQTTRFPDLRLVDPQQHPQSEVTRRERLSQEFHDPFPSNDMGPNTFTRPQGHIENRANSRRVQQAQILRNRIQDGYSPDPPGPTTYYNYNSVVRD